MIVQNDYPIFVQLYFESIKHKFLAPGLHMDVSKNGSSSQYDIVLMKDGLCAIFEGFFSAHGFADIFCIHLNVP